MIVQAGRKRKVTETLHMHTRCRAADNPKACKVNRTIQGGTMLNPRQRLIYPIKLVGVYLMITDGSSPISSLVPNCNPPKAVTLVLVDGTLVPMLPLCQASARGNPKGHYRNSHKHRHIHLGTF